MLQSLRKATAAIVQAATGLPAVAFAGELDPEETTPSATVYVHRVDPIARASMAPTVSRTVNVAVLIHRAGADAWEQIDSDLLNLETELETARTSGILPAGVTKARLLDIDFPPQRDERCVAQANLLFLYNRNI